MTRITALTCTLALALLAGQAAGQVTPNDERVECRDYKDVLALFDRLGYTQRGWQAGIREVPRVYLDDIPDTWRQRSDTLASVTDKKRLFFRVLGPIVLRINELIAADRARARTITGKLQTGESVSFEDQEWLADLAVTYKLSDGSNDPLDPDEYVELLNRVDVIPPSLALAQAASESGWGTSRFAREGNAMFGQWTWGGKGMTPAEQRTDTHGDYRVAAFESTALSAYSYALNLNTGNAYRDLRLRRAELKRQNLRVSGNALAETLLRYSERGQVYVDELKTLIRINRLDAVDDAYLKEMAVIHIVPAQTAPQ
jgi:Bax protein